MSVLLETATGRVIDGNPYDVVAKALQEAPDVEKMSLEGPTAS
jgi:hypothetical protein